MLLQTVWGGLSMDWRASRSLDERIDIERMTKQHFVRINCYYLQIIFKCFQICEVWFSDKYVLDTIKLSDIKT